MSGWEVRKEGGGGEEEGAVDAKEMLHVLLVDLGKVFLRTRIFCSRAHSTEDDDALRAEGNRLDARNEHNIPLPLFQPRLVQSLKVDDLLLQFPAGLGRQVLRRRHPPPRFANTGECRGRDELAQEVTARLASGAEDECRFRCFGTSLICKIARR